MDPKEYRKDYLARLERTPRRQTGEGGGGGDADLRAVGKAASTDAHQLMAVASDMTNPVETRLAAIQAINRMAFDLQGFREYAADYNRLLKALRTDRSSKVRSAAFQRLALSLDQDTRALLQKGLSGEARPLVPDTTAVTLLGVDDHETSRAALRAAAEGSAEPTRRAALRGLAADTRSVSLLERIASDPGESARVREAAALSLKVASPKRFVKLAKKIALDEREVDRLRATAVSALAHNAEAHQLAATEQFGKALQEASDRTNSRSLKSSIGRFRSLAG